MTGTARMQELIARLENDEPDRELGARVICFVRRLEFVSVEPRGTELNPACIAICAEKDGERFEFWANDPTISIDAALTLVPDGAGWWIQRYQPNGKSEAQILLNKREGWGNQKSNYTSEERSYATTPAIALCIAALKAREAQES